MRVYHITGNIIQRIAWLPLRIIFIFFLRMEFRGIQHLRKIKTNAIFAANHTHEFDPLIIVSCLPFFSKHLPLVFVSREKEFYKKLGWRGKIYGGFFFNLMAALQAYTGLNDYRKALKHHANALEFGKNVCIFPVGRKHFDKDIYQAKGGVTYLTKTSGLPIIPVRITGIEHMQKNDFFMRRRKLQVTFGKPLYSKNPSKKNKTALNKDQYEHEAVLLMKQIIALDSDH